MGEAKQHKRVNKIEENEALKLALFASQIDGAESKLKLLKQQFDTLQAQMNQTIKERDAFQAGLVTKYGINIKEDAIDLDTRAINRGALKKKLEAVPAEPGIPAPESPPAKA